MTDTSQAVFLSYASEDTEATRRIAEALRSAGIEVWFDKSELRGGDAWDQSIRRQIKSCALFIPVISKNTDARPEGYFRLEWKLAVDRSHLFTATKAFLLPVVIDDASDDDDQVPDRFRELQWTRLPQGVTPPEFVVRVRQLLAGETSTTDLRVTGSVARPAIRSPAPASVWSKRLLPVAFAVLVLGVMAYFAIGRAWISKHSTERPIVSTAVSTPPPNSVAVLPFVNLSGDKEQEYFSDGLTEELLNSLTEIHELQVAARTSAFSFKGQNIDVGVIARKLNVGAILEGSVRRSGNTVRITTQLINATTGFQLWSKTYDRDLGDVLKLQTDVATAVAGALKVSFLGENIARKIELGGTRNADAFDTYLRASKAYRSQRDTGRDLPAVIAGYTKAIEQDPGYALAFAGRAMALAGYAGEAATGSAIRENFEKAERDARRALTLAPDLAEAHMALANVLESGLLDFAQANEEYERAVALAPGNAQVLRLSGYFAVNMGRFDIGIAAVRRAVVLDPLARSAHSELGRALYGARRYVEAASAHEEVVSISPDFAPGYAERGLALYGLGDLNHARAACEAKRLHWQSQQCLAIVYAKLGRLADAQTEVNKMQASLGDASAYQYAAIYTQWNDHATALKWLDTAVRLRDSGLIYLKTDPLMDPLRTEPRFQAVMRDLKFPD